MTAHKCLDVVILRIDRKKKEVKVKCKSCGRITVRK